MTTAAGLSTPFQNSTMERLRKAVLAAVVPSGGVPLDHVTWWACQGDLRAIFTDPVVAAVTPRPLAAVVASLANAPAPAELTREVMATAGLGRHAYVLLQPFLSSTLPYRRVEGYCALLRRAAELRSN